MVDNSAGPLPPDELGHRLAEVYEIVGPLYRRVLRVVEQATPATGLSVGVRAVLERLIQHGPETVPAIARALALSRQFVQRNVNDAESRGFVVLRPNPAHRRSSLVALSDSGQAAINTVRANEHAAMSRVGGELTGPELDATVRVLRHMLTAVEQLSAEDSP